MKTVPTLYASSVSVGFTTVATLLSEVSEGFKDFLAALTGHHWVSKSILSLVVFALSYLILERTEWDETHMLKATIYLASVTLAGAASIFLFFVAHSFGLL